MLLITRPNPDGTLLLNEILSLGLQAWHYPPLLIESMPPSNNPQELIDASQLLIFTSPQAARFLPRLNIKQQKIIAIGQATAQALKERDIHCHLIPQQENSEGLLNELTLEDVKNKTTLIIKGSGGRTLLNDTLKKWGGKVTNLDIYKRIPNPVKLNNSILKKITHIHATSAEIIAALVTNCPENQLSLLKQKILLLSSSRLIETAKQLGFQHFELLADASSDSLLAWVKGLKP